MKQEAAQLSDEDLKTAVQEIQHWHKTCVIPDSTSIIRGFSSEWVKNNGSAGFAFDLLASENAILRQAAQRWIASLDKWQPIETAPTSGNTVFWAYPIKPNSLGRFLPETIFIVGEVAYNRHGSIDYADYSHWMPIPEPKQK